MAGEEVASCEFKVSLEDFKKLSPGEQNILIYSCLLDLQGKVKLKGKVMLALGAAAGLAGGFFHNFLFAKGLLK